ncbi:hypothetical protein CIRMBP1284_00008 [Enterococcus cecorum]|nr:hypothetical protein CIRMBP1251_00008 [Enterococcus cecorum]CAI3249942.1 hypothetical protein CIRMBP1266_00008 [Enterococcus cecorum]CAI3250246.1 hypothetical protein CIRMBP1244_00008 [Enterococcus cecorum]CAI3250248.1 hypothetical protein CIRMBP1284_00008 [Enterococcus cecorum]CAI3250275.1 hypothetical protein CIRMBP1245_00008 [Enterococcus cecorum]
MRLANGIVLDKEKTFGVLKFSALRHEVRVENEDGTTTEEIKRRTYDLKCSQQERTIQVSIPAEIPVKDYPYNAEVELINPVADTVANANYRGGQLPRGRCGMVHQGRRHCAEKQENFVNRKYT